SQLPAPPQLEVAAPRGSKLLVGTICGLLAAIGYTATNACLRQVATEDPMWVSCLRALPTVLLFGPFLLWRASRGERIWPTMQVMGVILVGAIASQWVGNWLFQWSLRVVGLAMAVPLCLGTLILGGALLGRIWLKEPITPRVAISLLIFGAAIVVLSLGAHDAHESVAHSLDELLPVAHSPWRIAAGVAAACVSGVFFAILGVTIRYSVTNHAAPTTMMFMVGLVGTAGLGVMTLSRLGVAGIADTAPADLVAMLGAGVLNALSFICMTKALQLTNVAYAYALNATQATMGALAGVLIFHEATTPWLGLGVALTIAGLLYMSRRR
ncbi:MAG TPA: DMT family transporter, partial [Verrucomicrobiae bacterium]|nr:DMT family transporter [Verrucomicrobiae bacterium]